ncbi:hypothetical protein DFJ43DRAFT_1159828 [Lentinula guzmanii]|uniref:Uncharacterized protein n=1 Tax=Lentinula guzmanii TaxID=2804957 RepID=A0AA38JA41_9AGAR|nr:hypothetical protein DFJ43DRAFT_1159828 [Lentinula guzmanii]
MSSYTYTAPPTSPTYGFFPSGVTSPNAFPTFHQSPRDSHAMYASAFSSSPYPNQANGQSQRTQGNQNPLKKLVSRNALHDDICLCHDSIDDLEAPASDLYRRHLIFLTEGERSVAIDCNARLERF